MTVKFTSAIVINVFFLWSDLSFQTPLIIYLFHFVVDYAEITFMVGRKPENTSFIHQHILVRLNHACSKRGVHGFIGSSRSVCTCMFIKEIPVSVVGRRDHCCCSLHSSEGLQQTSGESTVRCLHTRSTHTNPRIHHWTINSEIE